MKVFRLVGTQFPFWSSIDPDDFKVQGHLKFIAEALIRGMKLPHNGTVVEGDINRGAVYGPNNGTGMLGKLLRGEGDVALNLFSPTYSTFQYIDYTNTIFQDPWVIISSGIPKERHSNLFALFRSFALEVWMCCLVFSFFVPLVAHWLEKVRGNNTLTWTERIFDYNQLFVCKNMNETSSGIAVKIIEGCWFFHCFLFCASFTGLLLSKLSVPPRALTIDSIADIIKYYPKSKVLVPKDSSIEDLFRNSTDSYIRKLNEQILKGGGYFDFMNLEFLESINGVVFRDDFAFLPEAFCVEVIPLLVDDHYSHYVSTDKITFNVALPIRKDLPTDVKRKIRQICNYAFESHLAFHSLREKELNYAKCFDQPDPPIIIQLKTKHLHIGFLFLGFGFALAWYTKIYKLAKAYRQGSPNSAN